MIETSAPTDPAANPPVGPLVDATPRPLPARIAHRGASVTLEPLHLRHVPELWRAAQGEAAAASFAYMGYGPFAAEPALAAFVADFAAQHDPLAWAVRPHVSGAAEGWITLMEMQPKNAAIEIGNIWFGPRMQRSRAATEAMFLLMRHAMDDLGYRRLVWKCNALNAPSRRAAMRLGFVFEGELRAHLVIKGRRRDTAFFSMLDAEWPARRDAIAAWLDPGNWGADGAPKASLART